MNIGNVLDYVFPGGAAPSSAATWSALPAQLAAAIVMVVVCLVWRRRLNKAKADSRPAAKLVWLGIVMAFNAIALHRTQLLVVDWKKVHGDFGASTPLKYCMAILLFVAIGLFLAIILTVVSSDRVKRAEPLGYLLGGSSMLLLAGLAAKTEFVVTDGLGLRMATAWLQWLLVAFAAVLFALAVVNKIVQSRPRPVQSVSAT